MRIRKANIAEIAMTIIILAGCQNEPSMPTGPAVMQQDTLIQPPEQKHLTEEQLQKEINEEVDQTIDLENIISEASEMVQLTNQTITALLNENYTMASGLLDKTIAKAKLITMGGTEHTSVVSEVNIEMHDEIDNIADAIQLKQRVDSLIHTGDFQTARYLLPNMASEITITRASLSMPLYTKALEKAERLMDMEVYDQAVRVLNAALNKQETSHRAIPLPLIRAEYMFSEAELLIAEEENVQTKNIGKLLDNAEYQIKLMEVLGYGTGSDKYKQLYHAIHNIRQRLENNETTEAEKQINRAVEKLNTLRELVVRYETEKKNNV